MRKIFASLLMATMLIAFVVGGAALANPPAPTDEPSTEGIVPPNPKGKSVKPISQPNPQEYRRMKLRQELLAKGTNARQAQDLTLTGQDHALVIIVDFVGTDTFTWTPGVSTWDPIGKADPNEAVYDEDGNTIPGDCSNIITEETVFTYGGPTRNQIPRPLSPDDESYTSIWTEDFSKEWYDGFMFGDGVKVEYTMADGVTQIDEDFTGKSVRKFYQDISMGKYDITCDVVEVEIDHSVWWYGADTCPGARSTSDRAGIATGGAIPDAGSARTLVQDAVDAVNAISDTIPGFDWADYDQRGYDENGKVIDGPDGIIDRLWIVHAGYGEEERPDLLNRSDYAEANIWSHKSSIAPYSVTQKIAASNYIVMPENGGMAVFAHEHAHDLGAWDLYAYGDGETSTGFWALEADSWVGFPIGMQGQAHDPMHLDLWGWLDPYVVTNKTEVHTVTLVQPTMSNPDNVNSFRGIKIPLETGYMQQPVSVWSGSHYWWGGKLDLANSSMTTKEPIAIPAGGADLTFEIAYDIEDHGWDFLWVQVSADGQTWDVADTLTNENTQCETDPDWIGNQYGFPDDLCSAGLGGLYGHSADYPNQHTETYDLSAYAGQSVYLRLWYMTDWGTTGAGPFIDNVKVGNVFASTADSADQDWIYTDSWSYSTDSQAFDHNYYIQWRNVTETGGYDSALGDERWRFGPANSGMVVWYNNNFYGDNEIDTYLQDGDSFGPKGSMLVIDANPDPYLDSDASPSWLGQEFENITSRSLMRDAPFSLEDSIDFTVSPPYVITNTQSFTGRAAVSSFHDSLGYYPGIADNGDGTYWSTIDWDASAVVPAKGPYGVKADDDYPGSHIQYIGNRDHTNTPGYWAGFWNAEAGTGNPGDYGVQYGWHVEIITQTDTQATVRMWNSVVEHAFSETPEDMTEPGVHTPIYWASAYNHGPNESEAGVTFTIPSGLTVVETSPISADINMGTSNSLRLTRQKGGDTTVTWNSETLPVDTPITFTVKTMFDLQAGAPVTNFLAMVDLFDGNQVWHNEWGTQASQYGITGTVVGDDTKSGAPGESLTYTLLITNIGAYTDSYTISAINLYDWPTSASLVSTGELAPSGTLDIEVQTTISDTANGDVSPTFVSVTSNNDPMQIYTGILFAEAYGIYVLEPVYGTTIPMPTTSDSLTVTVVVTTPYLTVPDDGHWHLWVDGTDNGPIMSTSTSTELMSGTHIISAQLRDANHGVLGPVDTTIVTVTNDLTMTLLEPMAGETFTATNGMTESVMVAIDTNIMVPMEGHWHLWVDGTLIGPIMTTNTMVDLMTGTHTISADLRSPDHGTLGPVDVVTVTVNPAPLDIAIVKPMDGDVFTATNGVSTTVPITVSIMGTMHAHWHLWLDGADKGPVMSTSTSIELPVGTNVISAQLRDENHLVLGPVDTVTVTVTGDTPAEPSISIVEPMDGAELIASNGVSVTTPVVVSITGIVDAHWHLWLDGADNGLVMSASTSIELMTGTHLISAQLRDGNHTVLGPVDTVTVTVTAEETATNEVDLNPGESSRQDWVSSSGLTVTVEAGADTVTESITIIYTDLMTPSQALPNGWIFGGQSLSIIARRGDEVLPSYKFATPLVVTLSYPADDTAFDPMKLRVYAWDGSMWSMDGIQVTSVMTAEHKVTVEISHLTEFVLAQAQEQVYLPVVTKME